jgi:carbohydrate-binding DOMON domain-containing protein
VFAIIAGATALVYETIYRVQRCSRPKDEQPPENVGAIVKTTTTTTTTATPTTATTTTTTGQKDDVIKDAITPSELEPLKDSQDSNDGPDDKDSTSKESV